ncbi:glycosyltransferase family 25 protein [uncultured Tenacibaculum sp.]|uniref:glycosyltransferase family 25 protein n=1 Tax=uncultured Tenacibaculum sp. TaxID=174713 RepID=UPI00260396CD|nr:glycosyltransferase family 25 protein [uncultured Tenacibaculum sp.]
MKSYKVYYINLDKSVQRRDFMEDQFKKLNVPLERMPAVYGKELPSDFLRKSKKQHNILTHYPYLNDGEIGLTMTYFKLWEIIQNQEEDYAIVLEDDALLTDDFFTDLPNILNDITTEDFVDISGRKGFYTLSQTDYTTKFLVPPLQTTGQIIGKEAAKKLSTNLGVYYSPIDVIKQDVFKHKTPVLVTRKEYVKSNDFNIGGTTIQQKKMPLYKKVIREVLRPLWQLIALLTYKTYRFIRNYSFYKK